MADDGTDVEGVATEPSTEFDCWVAARAPSLLRFAYLMTGSQDAADESLQAALVKACEHWPRVRGTRDPDAYVRRMIVNAHISWWRRARRRESPVEVVRTDASTAEADDPATRVSQHDAVWRLCQSLPARQRAAVVLRFYEDLTYSEIAALLDCPESTVRSYIHRALASLRARIEQQEAADE